ncbi:MAG: bifunctional phosphoglucose/phosphomannose isomerase [Rhodothermales bacterium]
MDPDSLLFTSFDQLSGSILKNMTLDDVCRVDTAGAYEGIKSFPEQWREGRQRAEAFDWPGAPETGYRQVVVVGMGGSAIAGDLLRTLAVGTASVPIVVSRSYRLPAWVDAETVVIVSSYSGDTEETLTSMDEALRRRATVVCITSGGEVLDRARRNGLPYILLPGGMQPRAAIGYSFTAMLAVAERIRLLDLGDESWNETQELLEEQSERLAYPGSDNHALELARMLKDRLPFIYSSEGLLEAVNMRWRTQIHENSKALAVGNFFPELNHNEIMGWERQTALFEHVGVVVLRDREDHPRVQQRIDATHRLLAERAGAWKEVWSRRTSKLARMMSLVYLGDWVSLYLAVLHGVDPTPIRLISLLKETLQEA